MFLQQFCGVNVVIFYSQSIFIKAGSSIEPGSLNKCFMRNIKLCSKIHNEFISYFPGLSAFLVALCQVTGTGVAILVVDKFGRRILLILSSMLMCFSIFALGIYFFMDENKRVICPSNSTNHLHVRSN